MNRVQKIKKLKAGFKFYKNSFGLHPPYLILCDSNFLYAVIDSKIQLEETFKSVFKGQIYLKVSNCALHELDLLKAPKCSDTKRFAYNKCQRFNCNHKVPKKPSYCIYQALKQGFHGCVCTQDSDLRRKIHRDFPKIPVFFVSSQSMVILPPPKSLKEKVKNELIAKYAPQALKKENADPQKDIDDESSNGELVEEEEEEANDDINEGQTDINVSHNEQKTKKYDDIDVLQNDDENKEDYHNIEQEEEKINDDAQNDENVQIKRKRKHRHTINSEQNEQVNIENAENTENLEDVQQDTDIAQNENGNSDNKKHGKKRHHRTKPDNEN